MGELSAKLRSGPDGFFHWCPGCDGAHFIRTDVTRKPHWGWNGNVTEPITWPSVRCFWTDQKTKKEITLCHYFLGGAARNKPGLIEFCADSPHKYAGKDVLLPDFPKHFHTGD